MLAFSTQREKWGDIYCENLEHRVAVGVSRPATEMGEMKSLARRLAGAIPVAMIVLATWNGTASAQTTDTPAPKNGDTADQFKEGAQRIGEGAERIGEGIKQGAIQTWDAVKAGASAAAEIGRASCRERV